MSQTRAEPSLAGWTGTPERLPHGACAVIIGTLSLGLWSLGWLGVHLAF